MKTKTTRHNPAQQGNDGIKRLAVKASVRAGHAVRPRRTKTKGWRETLKEMGGIYGELAVGGAL